MKFDLDKMTEEDGLQFLLKRAAEKRQEAEKRSFDSATVGQFVNQYKPELLGSAVGGGLGALGAYAYGDDDDEPASSRAVRGLFGGMTGAGLGALGGNLLGNMYAAGLKPHERVNPAVEAKRRVEEAANSIAPQSELIKTRDQSAANSGTPLATGVPGVATGIAAATAANKYLPKGVDQGLLGSKLLAENAKFEALKADGKAVGATVSDIAAGTVGQNQIPAHLRGYAEYVDNWRSANSSSGLSNGTPPSFDEYVSKQTKPSFLHEMVGMPSSQQKKTMDEYATRASAGDAGSQGGGKSKSSPAGTASVGSYDAARGQLAKDVANRGMWQRGQGYRFNKPTTFRAALAGILGSAIPDTASYFLPELTPTRGYGPGMAIYNSMAPESWVSDAEIARRANQLTAAQAAERLKKMFPQN